MNAPDNAAEIEALRAEVAQFRLLANAVPVAIAYYESIANTCLFANLSYAQMFGFDEASIVGRSAAEVIGEDAERVIRPRVDQALQDRCNAAYERQIGDGAGGTRWIEVTLVPHVGPHGRSIGAFVLIADITHHRRAAAALRDSEERLAKFMHASAEGIVFHKGGFITDANPPLLALIGHTLDEIRGRSTLDFVAPEHHARVRAVMQAGQEIAYDSELLHRNGRRIPVEFIVRTLVHQGEKLRMTIVRDIRDRIEAQVRIHHLAHHDALTGLPNRLAFIERVQSLIAQADVKHESLALLFIDLDHFKRVNDSLGHSAGDMLLETVARRITGALRSGDLVARFGGDEFVLLLAGNPTPEAVREVADKLLEAIAAPLNVPGASISVTPSIGVALCPRDGRTPSELIKHADTAMYQAKSLGRANCRFFEPAMAAQAMAELAMESQLAQAVRDGEFVLHFQPQLALSDGRLRGVEALVRWNHPDRGLLGPDVFIPLAEARRLILPIGGWVLREALRWAVRWRAAGLLTGERMAVNLSTRQFQAPGFLASVQAALAEAGADGSMLELELTERMLMDDVAAVRTTLLQLKALGVAIAVDDFGTGYTSLAHLKDLPIDCLKIDRSFVRDLPGDRGAAAIARAIIEMARNLDFRVVAEGVEGAAQRDWVRAQGCDAQQGFFDASPMDAAAFEAWLTGRA